MEKKRPAIVDDGWKMPKEGEILPPDLGEGTATVPEIQGHLIEDALFIDVVRKDGCLHVHVFKPVEFEIRKQEAWIRTQCEALHPLSRDPIIRGNQIRLQKVQDRCDARREAWREGGGDARWPDIHDLLQQALATVGMNVFSPAVEFISMMDGWNITLYRAEDVPDNSVSALIKEVGSRFRKLGVMWPRERYR